MSRVWYPMILEVGEKDVVKGGNKKEKPTTSFQYISNAFHRWEYWELRYYKRDRQCSMDKSSKEGPTRKYIVIPSKFMFNADDLSINIKNSIWI